MNQVQERKANRERAIELLRAGVQPLAVRQRLGLSASTMTKIRSELRVREG